MSCGVPQCCSNRYAWLLRLCFAPVCLFLAALSYFCLRWLSVVSAVLPLALTALSVFAALRLPGLYVETLRYTRHSDRLLIDRGVLWRRNILIPRAQVRYVLLRRGPVERLFGLCTLEAHTSGGVVRLGGLEPVDANRLRGVLSASARCDYDPQSGPASQSADGGDS